jgi:sugar/nucleoside kinase (ribokinase family)
LRIAIVGDLAVDMVAYDQWMLDAGASLILKDVGLLPGGVAGNMAWVLNQLSIEPVIFSAVGKDYWGEFVREQLRRGGLKTDYVTLHNEPTGFFIIVVSPDGQRTMIGTRGANAKLRITAQVLSRARPDWVHVSGYSLLGEQGPPLFEEAKLASRIRGAHLSIDLEGVSETGIRPALKGAEVLCNHKEFENYFQSEMKEVAASCQGPIVVKAGAEGCYLLLGGRVKHIPTGKVKVRDTTGAGDAFNAGFVAARMRGEGLVAACNAGNLLGSEKVQHKGAKLTLRTPREKTQNL